MQTSIGMELSELCSLQPVQHIQEPCLRKVKLLAKHPTTRNRQRGILPSLLQSPGSLSLPLRLQTPGKAVINASQQHRAPTESHLNSFSPSRCH